MKETPIGLVIKEIAGEKNLKVSKLSEISGKSRQGIYVTFGRSEMNDEEIEEWGKTLGVTKDYLFDRWKKGQTKDSGDTSYLQQHLANLEEQFKALAEQLRVKDKQMEGMQRTIDVLLGKYRPATSNGKVMEMYLVQEKRA